MGVRVYIIIGGNLEGNRVRIVLRCHSMSGGFRGCPRDIVDTRCTLAGCVLLPAVCRLGFNFLLMTAHDSGHLLRRAASSNHSIDRNREAQARASIIARPIISGICGTTALPRAPTLSSR
jgi:hypothetical protein